MKLSVRCECDGTWTSVLKGFYPMLLTKVMKIIDSVTGAITVRGPMVIPHPGVHFPLAQVPILTSQCLARHGSDIRDHPSIVLSQTRLTRVLEDMRIYTDGIFDICAARLFHATPSASVRDISHRLLLRVSEALFTLQERATSDSRRIHQRLNPRKHIRVVSPRQTTFVCRRGHSRDSGLLRGYSAHQQPHRRTRTSELDAPRNRANSRAAARLAFCAASRTP
ncbi:hypothetical protein OH76DRAFT_1095433 [Lentinus brumalis]|uniref:Uncharacterized protein n=1 Tax=Lentinus brumalis TaxID=2498619 RepID=A0A371CW35_9APHY|nr:hypothetical protein OH76DRAFT_1095433 [Polyporus brumalis]